MAALTIGEWIDRCDRPVPEPLRRRLTAVGPACADTLVGAAEREAQACAAGGRRDRDAAFGLLAVDAYVTYACLWLVQNGGGTEALKTIAGRVAGLAWPE